VMAMALIGVCGAYVLINGLIMTRVINDLRLDTYVNFDTGLGVVMLILLLGWGPVWISRSLQNDDR